MKLLAGLLHSENDRSRSAAIAQDLGVLAKELLDSGDYGSAATAAQVLAEAQTRRGATGAICSAALDSLGESPLMRQPSTQLRDLDNASRAALVRIREAIDSCARATALMERRAEAVPLGTDAGRNHGQSTAWPKAEAGQQMDGDEVRHLLAQRNEARHGERVALEELERLRQQIQHLVTLDPVTHTLSHQGIKRALDVELKRTRRTGTHPVAILLECANLKQICQRCGRAVGDNVLVELTSRIQAVLRSSDHIARVGADEFLMLLPETGYWEGVRISERLLMKVNAPMEFGIADPLQPEAAVGVCMVPSVATSLDQVMELAHAAVEKAKTHARAVHGGQTEQPGDGDRVAEMLAVEGNYRVVRQPIVRLADGQVQGYEWLSRTTIAGLEMPRDFLQLAFTQNIVSVVDHLCLKTCLAGAASAADSALLHHINVFPSTILNTPLEQLLKSAGPLPYDRLCIEVTEHKFFGDGRDLRRRLAALRATGVRIALDDVGFGRTALELLILLEPDIVKIDRRFVKGVSTDRVQAAAFARLVEAVNALGAVIIAEGIETADDRRAVEQFGVPYGQGFLWPAIEGSSSPPLN